MEIATATGLAVPLENSDPATSAAIFRVSFDSFDVIGPGGEKIPLPTDSDMGRMSSGYWVHWIASDYSLAIVGSPELHSDTDVLQGKVWILSRAPVISADKMALVRKKVSYIGYDPSTIIENEGSVA